VALCGLVDLAYRNGESHRTVLAQGVTDGVHWTLFVTNQGDDPVCMGMTGERTGDYGFSCGFGPANANGDGPAASSEFPNGESIIFGPAPTRAATVTLTQGSAQPLCKAARGPSATSPVIDRLPPWVHPSGKWFAVAFRVPCGYEVTFKDSSGHVLPYEHF
jgi:hypothetical protein